MNKKQFLTYDEQITFLEEQKGLIISDKEYARKTARYSIFKIKARKENRS